eukprot:TRINITY_DN3460_c0_g1_i1.p1 TRINITY_DN3460_c0_g1~~TRINITY_DN3460_c0_g1_i1.p1  ORF type:complete len:112 (-),score=17.20 TRINITY_DN3460_c0_g1_i1:30-365(-)
MTSSQDDDDQISASLLAANRLLQKYCNSQNDSFLLCKVEDDNPKACHQQALALSKCAASVFQKISKNCGSEFNTYARCLEQGNFDLNQCRYPKGDSEKIFYACAEAKNLYP